LAERDLGYSALYQPHLERIYEDAALRAADLVQLEQIAAAYFSRERFLTELTLDPPNATSGEAGVPLKDEDYPFLSTIHSAKGPRVEGGLRSKRRRRLPPPERPTRSMRNAA
jgi:superfamily I DNA/RNA helicase